MSKIEIDSEPIAKTAPARSSGRRYESVDALMAGERTPEEVQKLVKQLGAETEIVRRLVEIRHQAGLTQEEVASRLGKTQGAVSKMESGRDDDLTLEEVRRYAEVTGRRIGLYFGMPAPDVTIRVEVRGSSEPRAKLSGKRVRRLKLNVPRASAVASA